MKALVCNTLAPDLLGVALADVTCWSPTGQPV
jgi:hypothetical protein